MDDDTISRQLAVDTVLKESNMDGAYGYMDTKSIVKLLNNQPSAPERKKGKWRVKKVRKDEYGNVTYNFICSECGAPAYEFSQPYCHRCGTPMEVK